MTLVEELATFLQNESVATKGTNLFIGYAPDTPDALTVLYETTTIPDFYLPWHTYTIQVLTRAKTYKVAKEKGEAVYHLLYMRHGELVTGGIAVQQVKALQRPTSIGQDDKQRYVFSHNYEIYTGEDQTQT
jgi:hypothetical protein